MVLSCQVTKNKKNQEVSCSTTGVGGCRVNRSFENLSIAIKSAKFKKLKLTKPKKSDLIKANSSETDLLTFRAKKNFIYLYKAFTEALIFRHLDPEYHI